MVDVAVLGANAKANPDNYAAQLAYGQALAAAGDKAAFEPLEKAAALVPTATGDDSPHALMAKLAEQLGDSDRAIKEYQASSRAITPRSARPAGWRRSRSGPSPSRCCRSRTTAWWRSIPSTRSGTAGWGGSR